MFRHHGNSTFTIYPLKIRMFIVQLNFAGRINNDNKGLQPAIRIHMWNLHTKLVNLERDHTGFFMELTKRRLTTCLRVLRLTSNRPPAIKMLVIASL